MSPRCTAPVILLLLATGCSGGGEQVPRGNGKQATFDVRHELHVVVPDGAQKVRIWFAMPQDVPEQSVRGFKVQCSVLTRIEKDSEGNTQVYCELRQPKEKTFTIVETFTLNRSEVKSGIEAKKARPYAVEDLAGKEKYLAPNAHVTIDDRIRSLAAKIVGDEKNPVLQARKIYDWELGNIDYWVKDPKNKKASPVGSTEYCLTTKTGNCTDFHSLWLSLARASGIPSRLVYGSFFKLELDGQDTDQSYHCWPEFYVPGFGWVPHDVAVANIFHDKYEINKDNEVLVRRTTADGYAGPDASKVEYYFGNIDERRVTWSVGRDLILSPRQDGGPVNALPKAYLEVDGKVYPEGKESWVRKLTYKERK
jgi:transglutaminase-like putative cysteine protease